ncbi:uncharacterized protein LOC119682679 isoform X2 [Teleopsis dalmanni]|nr:uncharacterized protein LOC119682679 isoform X2 [Teleopsis dalmanni]XP_037952100.1 uncharacterized protein LOC119682679 isoform X2 [Teleopsis dalmanni]
MFNELQNMENTNPGPIDENHTNNVDQSLFEAPGTSSKRQLNDDDENMPSSSKRIKSSKASWIYVESKNAVPFDIFDLANELEAASSELEECITATSIYLQNIYNSLKEINKLLLTLMDRV